MSNETDITDEDLVRSTLETGDPAYFDSLVSRYVPRIRSLVVHMTGNDGDADDLVQEIFVRAYRKLGSFRYEAAFFTWLYRIAINTVRNHQRRAGRNPVDVVDTPPAHPTAPHTSPDARAANKELYGDIEHALEKLSPKLKTAIVCHVIEGMSIATVAEMERCSQATVYWRIHTARKKLKKLLSEHL